MNKKLGIVVISIIFLAVVICFLTYFILVNNNKNSNNNGFFNLRSDNNYLNETSGNNHDLTTDVSEENNSNNDFVGANNGNSGGSGGSGTNRGTNENPNSKKNCQKVQISYSLGQITWNSICNMYENEVCINKLINCSAEIRNLEKTAGGEFGVEFTFYDKDNIETILGRKSLNVFIDNQESKVVSGSLIIPDENANKEISCYCTTLSVPKKEVCE